MKQRIQKVLASAGVASRRAIEEMVRTGRVAVNGTVQVELPVMIDVANDRITIDDEMVQLKSRPDQRKGDEKRVYILLNKPKGVYATNLAQGEQVRAIDLLPPGWDIRVYPVGRLDAQATGLLLLTNDGELTNQLTHPRYGVPKTYRAMVDGMIAPEALETLSQGVWLSDPKRGKGFKTGKCHVKMVKRSRDRSVIEITLHEGRNGQIRRVLAKTGHKVRELSRVRIGSLTLEGLAPGASRLLAASEVRRLRESIGPRPPRDKGQEPTAQSAPLPIKSRRPSPRRRGH